MSWVTWVAGWPMNRDRSSIRDARLAQGSDVAMKTRVVYDIARAGHLQNRTDSQALRPLEIVAELPFVKPEPKGGPPKRRRP